MTNKEKIEEFMSQIDESWSDLKKLRYICIKLCEIYEYNPKYAYGTEDEKFDIFNNLSAVRFTQTEEERAENIEYENVNKICLDLFEIYETLIKRLNIPPERCTKDLVSIHYTDERGIKYYIHPVEELSRVKTKRKPKTFRVLGETAVDEIRKIDEELGYIDETGYLDDKRIQEISKTENQELTVDAQIERVFAKGRNYLENIGVQINNVELYKFYTYLLKTAFPNVLSVIKPLSNTELEEIQYVLLARIKEMNYKWICLLYDKNERGFKRKTLEEVQEMMENLGLSEVGKDKTGISIGEISNEGR